MLTNAHGERERTLLSLLILILIPCTFIPKVSFITPSPSMSDVYEYGNQNIIHCLKGLQILKSTAVEEDKQFLTYVLSVMKVS